MIILNVTKNHGFTLSLENTTLEKPVGGGGGQTNTPGHFRVNKVTRLLSRHYWNRDPT